MAKSTKATDPAKAAIDAVEEALKLDFGGPEDSAVDDLDLDLDLGDELDIDDGLRKAPPVENATLAASVKKDPANDDRRSLGNLVYSLHKRPSSSPFWFALIISLAWLAGAAFLGYKYFDVDVKSTDDLIALINQPSAVMWLVATIVPILFFFIMAFLIWRAQEMRLAASSMSEVALRLAEPEDIATDGVVRVGQAVRREVAAMGDGVERVLARAGELEVLVHNEMMSLERSYSDNELRLSLIHI